jgi:hypothetical protein
MKIAFLAVGAVFFVLIVVGLFLPTHFSRARSISIRAETERVHAVISDLERWPEWTPWEPDPALTTKLGRITRGAGATRSWTGPDRDEELEIVTSDPASGITYEMTFKRGSDANVMKGAVSTKASGVATDVTWAIEGDMKVPVLGGYVLLAGGGAMDAMLDRGLSKLKQVVETK